MIMGAVSRFPTIILTKKGTYVKTQVPVFVNFFQFVLAFLQESLLHVTIFSGCGFIANLSRLRLYCAFFPVAALLRHRVEGIKISLILHEYVERTILYDLTIF